MRIRGWFILVVVVAVAVLIWATTWRRSSSADAKAKPAGGAFANMPVPVVAAPATARDLPVYVNGLGNVSAYNTVTVKTRVDGQLVKVNFREGQQVKQGELLAVIDPRPFEVQLHQAQGTLARDQAQAVDAKANLKRYEALFNEGVIARQQLDTQAAMVGQMEGAIAADRAQVENAKLQLVYTRVTAPITGVVGLRLVDIGNIVHASDPNGLLVITQLQPIAVLFTLPEDAIPVVVKRARTGTLQAEVFSRDNLTRIATGKLLTINNLIDTTTGTVRLKAVFENQERSLWPNQFVNVHLLLEVQKNALTVPTAAIQRGNQGTFTYVVKPDKSVEMRPVKVGVTEGEVVSVVAGLQPGDLVVTDGQDKLQPGSKIELRQPGGPGRPNSPNGGVPGSNSGGTPGANGSGGNRRGGANGGSNDGNNSQQPAGASKAS